jgi:hypothetical protein
LLEVTRRTLALYPSATPYEGLAYWAGRQRDATTYFVTAIVPRQHREPQRVVADEEAVGEAARAARWLGLGLLGQVHTHPGSDVRHSDGDDQLVLMPFEGMLSLVLPGYAVSPVDINAVGVHQFQDGRWVWIRRDSASETIRIAPRLIDLR